MDCSFQPDMTWFVFCTTTAKTLKCGFKTKAQAVGWMALRAKEEAAA
jgi:hypothetical protein